MKVKQIFFLYFLSLCTAQSFGMEDVRKHIVTFLDLSSAKAFFQTCKTNYSIYKNRIPIESFLLESNDACFALNKFQHLKAFVHFSQKNNVEMIKYLINNENDDNKQERNDILKSFHYKEKDYNNIEAIVRAYKGIKKEYRSTDERDLFKSVQMNNLSFVYIFLKNGVSPNIKDGDWTVLHEAVSRNKIEIAKLLIKYGANVTGETSRGCPPLSFAVNPEMKDILLKEKDLTDLFLEKGFWSEVFLEYAITSVSRWFSQLLDNA